MCGGGKRVTWLWYYMCWKSFDFALLHYHSKSSLQTLPTAMLQGADNPSERHVVKWMLNTITIYSCDI